MNIKMLKAALAGLALSIGGFANAGLISISNSGLIGADHTVNFDNGLLGTNVNSQFLANGLTFNTISGFGVTHTNNSNCNNTSAGVTNGYLYAGLSGLCSDASDTIDSFSINFTSYVSELSWQGFSRVSGAGFIIEAFNNNSLVSSILFNLNNQFSNKFVTISGNNFNQIKISELSINSSFFAMDNFAWNNTTQVPEPSTLAIFALGIMGLAARRFKKQ